MADVDKTTNEMQPDLPKLLVPLWDASHVAANELGPSSSFAQALRLVRLQRQGLIASLKLLGAIKVPDTARSERTLLANGVTKN